MASVPNSGSPAPPPPVWDARPVGPDHVAYGGFWIRVVAYIIDGILLTIVYGIVARLLGIDVFESDWRHYDPLGNLISLVIGWLYFALLESSERGATVGKMAMGLRVVTSDGQRLSFMNATGRYFAKILSAIILCIGFIMVGLHRQEARPARHHRRHPGDQNPLNQAFPGAARTRLDRACKSPSIPAFREGIPWKNSRRCAAWQRPCRWSMSTPT